MGCDIHIVMERREGSEWIGIWSSDVKPFKSDWPIIARRDYAFFSRFAVRGSEGNVIYPRNLPKDVSRLAWFQYMKCPTDNHSASHASIKEFCDAWLSANDGHSDVRAEFASYDLLGLYGDEDEGEHRVVFWFDN